MAVVEVYSTMLCPFCYRAKKLLAERGAAITEIDITMYPERRHEMMRRAGGRTSVPQIFIDGRHVGGCEELYALDRAGRLAAMLEGAAP